MTMILPKRFTSRPARPDDAKAPPDVRVALNQQVLNTDTAAQDLLRLQGYTLARTEFRMLIDLDDLPPLSTTSVGAHGGAPSFPTSVSEPTGAPSFPTGGVQ